MIGAMLFASVLASAAGQGGCADHWAVVLNAESFASNGAGKSFGATELEAFRSKAEGQIKAAINAACQSGAVKSAAARGIERISISSASGASDPFIYSTAKGQLTFEWIFAEEDLAIPAEKDVITGAACWTNPDGPACSSPGD
ncbi:hypothetical protein GCM10023264_07140 [Sphingomonas daechungensis]|uniref:Uncharacterized protein n=1 Tax=Sphingomonas daechungensis TaxID=1176646 RepID=A0ABX6SZN2_9SPHN|nr:hypothetical protein [Sphingomonas daechungensis]QNP43037.1 hypothetical protein H9L15_13830 [Sphingomonas daechungensis]